ncbi:nucleotidyl transferase AbiEii/AbiGii toxin family protein [Flavobacterium sp. WW92]|uniref:nucleotidyl transferase AbiEii/AbiGii toxin family protein n=1 Tax=unclassified Flavobacterium TaxID=196869 RepID=UPI002225AE86|nr:MULTISPECIES: nucleotidyl transferase AbiEii/AbiGii toxin family protein [unclassified Flavobacterium]WDO12334.1 nucleotidyl transferase AbiEii/AbiGii toxin family protein [Flavobacterium sp. WW92]
MTTYLHQYKDFPDLLSILSSETGILPQLIEKDYWIMHVLYGLKQLGFAFELKGGTSLSKGYNIIHRFSEDIDIRIMPPEGHSVEVNPKKIKDTHIASRKDYYDWLAATISIEGIIAVERDTAFDDQRYYRSGGIRLIYESVTGSVPGLKDGILLEAGFDTVTPNTFVTISSWAYDKAIATPGIAITDNRAMEIACYHPGYTFVEKLQTIATKFRQQQSDGMIRPNLLRQYYDVACLLEHPDVDSFIGTKLYNAHKAERFPKQDLEIPLAKNQAFLLEEPSLRAAYETQYVGTAALYYKGQPVFDELLARIKKDLSRF